MDTIDWKNLPFGYMKTDFNVRCYFRNGQWGELETSREETIPLHMAATSLHYGQEIFEGLKAYRGLDGRIRLFRWQENARRMAASAHGILMQPVPEALFEKAVKTVVKLNEKFVPPFGSGATLYIRPLLIGSGPEVGVRPSEEYLFMVFVTPVGPYFKEGFKPVDILLCRDYDRAAPNGTGKFKVGGNYAASLMSLKVAKDRGYATALYLDPKEKKYVDEAGPANFFGVKANTYITPDSPSILESITNLSIMEMARKLGMKVEKRKVPMEELATFEEAGFCGTAAVICPIHKIVDDQTNRQYIFCKENKPGPVCTKLYNELTALQFGETPDTYGWVDFVE